MNDHHGSVVLKATGVTVRFGGLTALNQVGIALTRAAITGLVGPNGAGKTTLFGVLSGLQRCNAGRVRFESKDISKALPQERARAGLARTFQQPRLFPGLTVRQHVALAYRLRHSPRRIWRDVLDGRAWFGADGNEEKVVTDLLGTLGIDRHADARVIGMPLGLSRLVELARALAARPSALLLDEASSGLDQHERDRLAKVLAMVPGELGTAILLVEHDVELVLGLSQKVYVLDFGAMIAEGTPQEIRNSEVVKAAYLGGDTPPSEGATR